MRQYNPASRIISAIDRYSRYLNEFTNQQINIAEKTTKILEKKRLEEFGTKIQEQFKNAKNLSDIINTGSTLISDAVSNGLTEAIPLINQQLQLRMSEFGYKESENLNQLLLENNKSDELVIQNGKLVSKKDIIESEEFKNLSPESQNKYLASLPKPQYELSGSIINNKEQLFESIKDPITGKILQTQVYNIFTENNRKYYKKNNIKEFVPDKVIDELSNERQKLQTMQFTSLQLKQMRENLRPFSINHALNLQKYAYYMKENATEQIVQKIAESIIDNDPDTYNTDSETGIEKTKKLYEDLRKMYTSESISQFTTPEGRERLKDYIGEQAYSDIKDDLSQIEEADETLEKSNEVAILSTDYKNDKNFQDSYYEYQDKLKSLFVLDLKDRIEYAEKIADKLNRNADEILNRLSVIMVNYNNTLNTKQKVKQVYELYKLLR